MLNIKLRILVGNIEILFFMKNEKHFEILKQMNGFSYLHPVATE